MSEFVEVKTQELYGSALDWSVAQAAGWVNARIVAVETPGKTYYEIRTPHGLRLQPSLDWSQGGPLILNRGVSLRCIAPTNAWEADCWDDSVVPSRYCQSEAETPLIATCRSIVASVLGDTVKVPKELLS